MVNKYVCKVCNTWVDNNVAAREMHERSDKHKEKAAKFLERQQKDIKRKSDQEAMVERELARVSRAASRSFVKQDFEGQMVSSRRFEGGDFEHDKPIDRNAKNRTDQFINNQGGGSYYEGLMARTNEKANKEPKLATQAPTGLNRKERRAMKQGGGTDVMPVGAPPMVPVGAPPPMASDAQELPLPSVNAPRATAALSVEDFVRMRAEAETKAKEEVKRKLSERELMHERKTEEGAARAFGDAGFSGWSRPAKVVKEVDSDDEEPQEVAQAKTTVVKQHDVTHTLEATGDQSMQSITTQLLAARKDAAYIIEDEAQETVEAEDGTPMIAFKRKKRKVQEMSDDDEPTVSTKESSSITVTKVSASGKRRNFRRKVED